MFSLQADTTSFSSTVPVLLRTFPTLSHCCSSAATSLTAFVFPHYSILTFSIPPSSFTPPPLLNDCWDPSLSSYTCFIPSFSIPHPSLIPPPSSLNGSSYTCFIPTFSIPHPSLTPPPFCMTVETSPYLPTLASSPLSLSLIPLLPHLLSEWLLRPLPLFPHLLIPTFSIPHPASPSLNDCWRPLPVFLYSVCWIYLTLAP